MNVASIPAMKQEELMAIGSISHDELQWVLVRAEELMRDGYSVDEAKSIIAREAQKHPWKSRTH